MEHTRSIIDAVLNSTLNKVSYEKERIFGLNIPLECPNVPRNTKPWKTWQNKDVYTKQAKLAKLFNKNFEKFNNISEREILEGGPIYKKLNNNAIILFKRN